jgi:hypothetical protein
MVFELELHRMALALLRKLAGGTGNQPTALLQLRCRDISVSLLPDLEGSEWPSHGHGWGPMRCDNDGRGTPFNHGVPT